MSTVVDGLAYAGASLFGDAERTVEAIEREAAAAGVTVSVLAPVRPPDHDLARASAALADHAGARGHRVLVRVDPWQADAPSALERLLAHPAVGGLLLHPWEETIAAHHPRCVRLARLAADAGRATVVETGFPMFAEAPKVAELARAVAPGAVVATRGAQLNMSGLGQRNADLALERAPNLSVSMAGMYRQDWLERVIHRFGPERVLF